MDYGYDALLYKPQDARITQEAARVQKMKNGLLTQLQQSSASSQNQKAADISFHEMLQNELSEQGRFPDIPSSQFNSALSREKVFLHIGQNSERKKLYDAAREFESFFTEQMFKQMQKNVPKNNLFHGGMAEEIFEDMLLSERVKGVSQNSQLGLAEMIYKQLQNL